jgi:PleD family two-component response regulator
MANILFADDDADMRLLVAEVLGAHGHQVRVAPDGRDTLVQIRVALPDVAVLDVRMGTPDGVDVCRAVRAEPAIAHLPILLLTGENQPDDRLRGFDAGADDYLGKPFDPRELVARVEALIRRSRRDLERNPTSGLPGGHVIREEIERRLAAGQEVALCYFDVDHFKPFGDRFGFATGDLAIRAVAEAISGAGWSAGDFVGHVGGDDFVAVSGRSDAAQLALAAQLAAGERIAGLVSDQVRAEGSYVSRDREGRAGRFPLPRVSVAVLHLAAGTSAGAVELGGRIAELKRAAKHSDDGFAEAGSAV